MKSKIQILIIILSIIIFGSFIVKTGCGKAAINSGTVAVPSERNIQWNETSVFYDWITNIWSKQTIKYGKAGSKVNAPRILLARFHRQKDLAETNRLLMAMKVWGVSGSAWALNKKGDYDFTSTVLTTILWQFGDKPDILYPETRDYLLNVLLVEDGDKFRSTAPRTLGLFPETENHILMTEGSRYLKNKWLASHGNSDPLYNNEQNGMEKKLLSVLKDMNANGLYEFNSMPYIGYTLTALLNLEAYASDKVSKEARKVLDYLNFCYALGTYNYQHFPPIRRRYERANWHELTTDYHSVFFKAWMSFLPGLNSNFQIGTAKAHALMGACMPYRPADKAVELLLKKKQGYFFSLGHGKKASPEIYSAGMHFLLSAGGVNRGQKSHIVARPICLFIDNDASHLNDVFHLAGPGSDFKKWNNTGVYKHFACAAGPVFVPKGFEPLIKDGNWAVYQLHSNLVLMAYSTNELGIMALFEQGNYKQIMSDVSKVNSNEESLMTQFQFPGGTLIEFDVNSPKDKWVIKSVEGKEVNREYDSWPLINGSFN